jgi:hypothetical protein
MSARARARGHDIAEKRPKRPNFSQPGELMNNQKRARERQEAQWALSADLVRRMFVDLDSEYSPSIRCPFYNKNDWQQQCDGIPHMHATVLGRGIPEGSTSGAGLIIQFTCENGHEWQLRWSDHSGGTGLTMVETNSFCHECPFPHPKGSNCFEIDEP